MRDQLSHGSTGSTVLVVIRCKGDAIKHVEEPTGKTPMAVSGSGNR